MLCLSTVVLGVGKTWRLGWSRECAEASTCRVLMCGRDWCLTMCYEFIISRFISSRNSLTIMLKKLRGKIQVEENDIILK